MSYMLLPRTVRLLPDVGVPLVLLHRDSSLIEGRGILFRLRYHLLLSQSALSRH